MLSSAAIYIANCLFCHGVPAVHNGGNIPNLGYSSKEALQNAGSWVYDGGGVERGMPVFSKDKLPEEDLQKAVAFVQALADQTMAAAKAAEE